MITVRNKDDGTVCTRTGCGIDELVLSWGWEHISSQYYDDHETEVEMVAFRLLESINNSTGSSWGNPLSLGGGGCQTVFVQARNR